LQNLIKGVDYLDSFFGTDQFSGEEVVYEVKVPIWSMNYIGSHYTNSLFTYHNQVDGSFEWFEGYEEIFFGDNKVYVASITEDYCCKYESADD